MACQSNDTTSGIKKATSPARICGFEFNPLRWLETGGFGEVTALPVLLNFPAVPATHFGGPVAQRHAAIGSAAGSSLGSDVTGRENLSN